MGKFKDLLKYTPPEFRLFEEKKRGLLFEAGFRVDFAYTEFIEADAMNVDEFEAWGKKEILGTSESDLVDLYGHWTMADDLLKRLDYMDGSERTKHLELDHKLDIEKVAQKFTDLTVELRDWEAEKGKKLIYPVLNHHLRRRLDYWERYLDQAADRDERGNDFLGDEERMYGLGDYCNERTLIEYAAMGIAVLQVRQPGRLEPLPYFETFIKRRLKLDECFCKALNGRYHPAPWADPSFWWHWPPAGSKNQPRRK